MIRPRRCKKRERTLSSSSCRKFNSSHIEPVVSKTIARSMALGLLEGALIWSSISFSKSSAVAMTVFPTLVPSGLLATKFHGPSPRLSIDLCGKTASFPSVPVDNLTTLMSLLVLVSEVEISTSAQENALFELSVTWIDSRFSTRSGLGSKYCCCSSSLSGSEGGSSSIRGSLISRPVSGRPPGPPGIGIRGLSLLGLLSSA
mmetsp:Transcript_40608/g.46171  ORF Transcript_40608/g.46171 Transcript_40608/m.46171 type:complete len:202 (-) Transcript_40608:446-1051(-)